MRKSDDAYSMWKAQRRTTGTNASHGHLCVCSGRLEFAVRICPKDPHFTVNVLCLMNNTIPRNNNIHKCKNIAVQPYAHAYTVVIYFQRYIDLSLL